MQPFASNFLFLAAHDQGLARLGALAERAFHDDPPTTLGKLRQFGELLTKLIAARHGVEIPPRESFEGMLRLLRDKGVLPRQPAELFHYLRRVGNAVVHDDVGTPSEALRALKQARQLGIWFVRGYGKDRRCIARSCAGPGRRRPARRLERIARGSAGMAYRLVGRDGKEYMCDVPGTLGGYDRKKIYGKLDCPSALRAIAEGGYVQHRVFFADEETAIAAGYRPCAKCCPAEYRTWKAARAARGEHDRPSPTGMRAPS